MSTLIVHRFKCPRDDYVILNSIRTKNCAFPSAWRVGSGDETGTCGDVQM